MTAISEAGGPKTAQGKEVVRWNATRHGISSPRPVVPGLEKLEDWEEHRSGILENLSPVGHLEFSLAERVALLSWRLHRVTRYETEAIALSQQKIEIEEEIEEESLELPGVPEDADVAELPAMKVGDVRGCVEAIAAHIGEDPDELLEAAAVSARLDASSAKVRAEELEGEIDVMNRERILPDDKTLEKIARYEAHLSRQLYHALHELENLQKHRTTGEGVPLARLAVQGLPES
jgi:hypothetical protein